MTLDRNSFVVKVAYFLRRYGDVPQHTSLCKIFWLFWIKLLIVIPIVWILRCILLPFCAYFFDGTRVVRNLKTGFLDPNYALGRQYVPVKHLPIFSRNRDYDSDSILYGNDNVPPFMVIFIVITVGFSSFGLTSSFYADPASLFYLIIFLGLTFLAFLVGVLVLLALTSFKKFCQGETWGLIRLWLKAKKQKICPLVDIK